MQFKQVETYSIKQSGVSQSHIFFVDGLILFEECSVNQITTMLGVLDKFCSSSEEKVSVAKTKIYFSKHITANLRSQIKNICGFVLFDYLGKYLGTPVINGHLSSEMFGFFFFLVTKVRERLNGWIVNRLSFAV